MVVHPRAAVCTEHLPGQRIDLACHADAALGFALLLHCVPCLLIDNGLVGVVEDHPLGRIVPHTLGVVGFLGRAEVDRVPGILRLGQDRGDGLAVPVVGAAHIDGGFPGAALVGCQIIPRRLYLVIPQRAGNDRRPHALQTQLVDPADDVGGFLVDQPCELVVRVAAVAVDRRVGDGLAAHAALPEERLHLPGLVAQVPFVDDVQERCEFIGRGVAAVEAVGYGDEAHAVLAGVGGGVIASQNVVSTDAAQVFCNDRADLASLNVSGKARPAGTVKIAARPAVVRVVDAIRIAMLCSIAFKVFLLIHNGAAVARHLVVAGEAFIQGGNLGFSLLGCHIRRSFQTAGRFVVHPLYHKTAPCPALPAGSVASISVQGFLRRLRRAWVRRTPRRCSRYRRTGGSG